MSDSFVSPPTESPPQPASPRTFDAGDIDIEMLLDQAQALVDDAAEDLNREPPLDDQLAPEMLQTAEAAALEPPPAASQSDEIVAILEAAAENIEDTPAESPAVELVAIPPPAEAPLDSPVEAISETVAPVAAIEPSAAPSPTPETVDAAPPPANDIALEDFSMPAGSEPAQTTSPSATATAVVASSPSAPPIPRRPDAFPLRLIAAAVLLADRPFARLSDEARRRVGWIAAATFLMGAFAWLAPLLHLAGHPHK